MNTNKKSHPLLKNVPVPAVLDNDNLPPAFQSLKDEFLKRVQSKHAGNLPPGVTEVDVVFTKNDHRIIMRQDIKAPDIVAYGCKKMTDKKGREAFVITADEKGNLSLCFVDFPAARATEGFWLKDRLAIKACIYEMKVQIANSAPGTPYRLDFHLAGVLSTGDVPPVDSFFRTYECKELPGMVVTEWLHPTAPRWTLKLKGSRTMDLRTFNPAEGR